MIDPLYRTAIQGRDHGLQSFLHSNAGEDGEGRADHTVRWDSPNFNGLKVAAFYTLDSDERDGKCCCTRLNAYNRVLKTMMPTVSVPSTPTAASWYLPTRSPMIPMIPITPMATLTAWKVGGKYTINNFAVMGQYEDIENDISACCCSVGLSASRTVTQWHLVAATPWVTTCSMSVMAQVEARRPDNSGCVQDDSESTAVHHCRCSQAEQADHRSMRPTTMRAGQRHADLHDGS